MGHRFEGRLPTKSTPGMISDFLIIRNRAVDPKEVYQLYLNGTSSNNQSPLILELMRLYGMRRSHLEEECSVINVWPPGHEMCFVGDINQGPLAYALSTNRSFPVNGNLQVSIPLEVVTRGGGLDIGYSRIGIIGGERMLIMSILLLVRGFFLHKI